MRKDYNFRLKLGRDLNSACALALSLQVVKNKFLLSDEATETQSHLSKVHSQSKWKRHRNNKCNLDREIDITCADIFLCCILMLGKLTSVFILIEWIVCWTCLRNVLCINRPWKGQITRETASQFSHFN